MNISTLKLTQVIDPLGASGTSDVNAYGNVEFHLEISIKPNVFFTVTVNCLAAYGLSKESALDFLFNGNYNQDLNNFPLTINTTAFNKNSVEIKYCGGSVKGTVDPDRFDRFHYYQQMARSVLEDKQALAGIDTIKKSINDKRVEWVRLNKNSTDNVVRILAQECRLIRLLNYWTYPVLPTLEINERCNTFSLFFRNEETKSSLTICVKNKGHMEYRPVIICITERPYDANSATTLKDDEVLTRNEMENLIMIKKPHIVDFDMDNFDRIYTHTKLCNLISTVIN